MYNFSMNELIHAPHAPHPHLLESHHEAPVHLLSQRHCRVHPSSRDKPRPEDHGVHVAERSHKAEDEDARKGLDLRGWEEGGCVTHGLGTAGSRL